MIKWDVVKWYLQNIDMIKFVKYNYFSKNVIRDKNCFLRPYKNAVIDLQKSSKIYIKGKHIDIGANKLKGSKVETYLRMGKNAVWNANNGAYLYYNSDLEIKDNAVFTNGFFSMNTGCTIICTTSITLGNNVMMGRNNIIYDSDFHSILNKNNEPMNYNRKVVIEDNVWLTTGVVILKGAKVGQGSILTSNTVVTANVPPESIASGNNNAEVRFSGVKWSRKYPGQMKKKEAATNGK